MTESEVLRAQYVARHSPVVRQVTEHFCGAARALPKGSDGLPEEFREKVRRRAKQLGIDIEDLTGAVFAYSVIEITEAREGVQTPKPPPLPAVGMWRWFQR